MKLKLELKGDDNCFGCGAANESGLRLKFTIDEAAKSAEAVFVPTRRFEGYVGYTHGGIIAAVLDEAMLKLCWELGIPAVTAKLEVKLRAPVAIGSRVKVRGWIAEDSGKVIKTAAALTDERGAVVAEARGTAVVKGTRASRPNPGR